MLYGLHHSFISPRRDRSLARRPAHVGGAQPSIRPPFGGGSRDEERQESSTVDRGRLSFRTGPDLIPPPEVCAPKPFLATTLRWWTWFYVIQRRSSDDIALPELVQEQKADLEANYIDYLNKCPTHVIDPLRADRLS